MNSEPTSGAPTATASATTSATSQVPAPSYLILTPVERVTEVMYGILMATSITGSISVATARQHEIWTMLVAALGCNIAWGLTDAVMHLVAAAIKRHRQRTLYQNLQAAHQGDEAHLIIAAALPEPFALNVSRETLELLRRQMVDLTMPEKHLGLHDYRRAGGIFLWVVLATFPVVLPFLVITDALVAVRVSNLLALITLFIGGWVLGRYAGGQPWRYGLVMGAIGLALVVVIVALGG